MGCEPWRGAADGDWYGDFEVSNHIRRHYGFDAVIASGALRAVNPRARVAESMRGLEALRAVLKEVKGDDQVKVRMPNRGAMRWRHVRSE
jgi:hypothetical protein